LTPAAPQVIKIGYDVDNDGIPDQLSAGNVDAKELHDAVKDAMMTLDMSATDAIEFEKLHILAKTFDLFIYDPGASLYDSTFSRTVWRRYGGAKGHVVWY
jgi:hypothetical protein